MLFRSCKTTATDGRNFYFNPEFIQNLSQDEQTFAFAHSIFHVAFAHIFKGENKKKELWDVATDAVINAMLRQDGLESIEGSIDIPYAVDYDSEEMYQKLLEEDDFYNYGHNIPDNHLLWERAIEERQKHQECTCKSGMCKQNGILNNAGEKGYVEQNRLMRKEQFENLKIKLVQQSRSLDCITNSVVRKLEDIDRRSALIDWRRLLREAVNSNVDWSYRNATIEDGVVIPHLEETEHPETEILLDTSGSVSELLLKNFLRECMYIIENSKVKVGCFDTRFYGFNEIRSIKEIDSMKILGRGGTNFNVAVNAFSHRAENKIIFTDGYASMPKKTMNAIWVIYGDRQINPKGGKVINITDRQLNKLLNYNGYNKLEDLSR